MRWIPAMLLAGLMCLVFAQGTIGGELDALLARVRDEGRVMDRIDRERETRFRANEKAQAQRLAQARQELAGLEADNAGLRGRFQENRTTLADLKRALDERSKDLQSLFQAARQTGTELTDMLGDSLVSAEFPDRGKRLAPLLENERPLTLEDLNDLWYLLLQEIVEGGKVTAFRGEVVGRDGANYRSELVRVGTFNVIQGDNFLHFADNRLYQLGHQPSATLRQTARLFAGSRGTLAAAVVDPGRGAALEILGKTPGLGQRIRQGGPIGYLILGLGGLGLLIGIWRLLDVALISRRMRGQLRDPERPSPDNPLGRVLLAGQRLAENDPVHLELHLQEAALREIPRLTLAQSFLKLLAAVSPLLGLLGTVTGMILTFQAITLAGTANSSLMADGIGQALVTTVLGLTAAIPMLFLHNLLASRSRSLIRILDQETAGLIVQATGHDRVG